MSGATLSNLLAAAKSKLSNVMQMQWQGTSTRAFLPAYDRLRVDEVNRALFAQLRDRNANPRITGAVTPVDYDPAKDALKLYNDAMRNRVIGPW